MGFCSILARNVLWVALTVEFVEKLTVDPNTYAVLQAH